MTPTSRRMSALSALLLLAACLLAVPGQALAAGVAVTLSGSQEVPPNNSAGKGSGQVTVMPDGAVSGAITVTGMTPTVAHIHDGAAGKNGPVIVKLDKTDTGFAVPPGTRFNEAQMASFKAGNTYINVHSEAFPPGEIRGQLNAAEPGRPPSAY